MLTLLPLLAHGEAWDSLGKNERWQILKGLAQTPPMNWGAGGAGINYGGGKPEGECREPLVQDAAAPSSGYCLGVSVFRTAAFAELVGGTPATPGNRKDVADLHESAGAREYGDVQDWMRRMGETNYDRALARNAASMKTLLAYAKKYPGRWIGLKSQSVHHAVQVFEVAGDLVIVDPNVPQPMFGRYTTNGFEWSTFDGKSSATVDFAYLPARTWR